MIGLDATGALPEPNGAGIVITSSGTTVGGTRAGDANLIAGNTGDGIDLSGPAASDNLIEGNTISNNADDGVKVDAQDRRLNSILTNALFADARLEIELLNHGNDDQPPPVLTGIGDGGTSTTIAGTLHAAPNTTYLIQFFSSPATTSLGFSEAKAFLAQTTVTSDATGSAAIAETLTTAVPDDQLVSATATEILAGAMAELQFAGAPNPVILTKTGGTSVISNAANPTRSGQTLPLVSIAASPGIVTASANGTRTVTITVTLTTTSSEQTVIVPYTSAGYIVTPGPLAFIPPVSGTPIARTFSVTIAAEPPDAAIQSFSINLGQPTNAILDTRAAAAAISIYPSP